jgi:hypothetical protein
MLAQEGTTRRLVEHCGLPWHPSFLRFYETQRSVQTASQLQVCAGCCAVCAALLAELFFCLCK